MIVNHLWQSTLFALAAIPLTALLRHNRAQVRFWIWLAASVKFLIPFSLLVNIGRLLPAPAPSHSAALISKAAETLAIPQIAYTLPPLPSSSNNAVPLLGIIWAVGFFLVAARWFLRWRSVQRIAAQAERLNLSLPIPARSSGNAMEPGVFGILHPVLLLPEGITTRLAPEQMQAIVAHELCHVRRRDNLTSAIHMAVEAIFWFHPLVWWIGSRLIEERERACDEEVLRQGNAPDAYAEGILTICKFCLESPLPCIAGVTGSPLKHRIESIMARAMSRKLDVGRKALLACAALCAILAPLAVGVFRLQAQQPRPLTFDVATIKPSDPNALGRFVDLQPAGTFKVANMTVKNLIKNFRHIRETQILGGPTWIGTDKFDITAKYEQSGLPSDLTKFSDEQREDFRRQIEDRVNSLLTDRFHLVMRNEAREMPVYALTIAKGGSKLRPPEDGEFGPQAIRIRRGALSATSANTEIMSEILADRLDKPVIDRTGLKGRFNWKLEWTPDPPPGTAAPELSGPSLFTAVQEQLGLKLEPVKAMMPVLIIERAEKPTAN